MLCDSTEDVKLYWNFSKQLCYICVHKSTIDEQSIRKYYKVKDGYKYQAYEVLRVLPGLEIRKKRQSHYWLPDFKKMFDEYATGTGCKYEEYDDAEYYMKPDMFEALKKQLMKPLEDEVVRNRVFTLFARM